MSSTYIKPDTVIAPQAYVKNLKILYDGKDGSFSIATMTWDGADNTYGIRWNGYTDGAKINKGSPISTGHPVWFILPSKVVDSIDFEKLFSEDDPQTQIVDKIEREIAKQKIADPDAFSLKVRYESVNIPEPVIADLKNVLSAKSITLISYKNDRDCTVFNVAYA